MLYFCWIYDGLLYHFPVRLLLDFCRIYVGLSVGFMLVLCGIAVGFMLGMCRLPVGSVGYMFDLCGLFVGTDVCFCLGLTWDRCMMSGYCMSALGFIYVRFMLFCC